MLKTALLYDLRLASDALMNDYPGSAYRLTQLAGIIVADDAAWKRITYMQEAMHKAVQEMDAAERADVNDE